MMVCVLIPLCSYDELLNSYVLKKNCMNTQMRMLDESEGLINVQKEELHKKQISDENEGRNEIIKRLDILNEGMMK